MANADAAPAGTGVPTIAVELVFSPAPRRLQQWTLRLAMGSTLADAVAACGEAAIVAGLADGRLAVGVWGRVRPAGHLLREGDRVEVYRRLTVDPKEARRQRFVQAGGAETLRARRKARLQPG